MQNPETLNSVPIVTRLFFQGAEIDESRTIEQLQSNGFFVDFYLTPGDFGDSTITVRVDAVGATIESNEANNESSRLVTVKETTSVQVAFLRADCKGPVTKYADTIRQSVEYLRAFFPVAPSELTYNPFDTSAHCLGNFAIDMTLLWLQGRLLNPLRELRGRDH